jgi:hypothetical protein
MTGKAYSTRSLESSKTIFMLSTFSFYKLIAFTLSQDAIWREVGDALEERDKDMRKVAAKRAFVKPEKKS